MARNKQTARMSAPSRKPKSLPKVETDAPKNNDNVQNSIKRPREEAKVEISEDSDIISKKFKSLEDSLIDSLKTTFDEFRSRNKGTIAKDFDRMNTEARACILVETWIQTLRNVKANVRYELSQQIHQNNVEKLSVKYSKLLEHFKKDTDICFICEEKHDIYVINECCYQSFKPVCRSCAKGVGNTCPFCRNETKKPYAEYMEIKTSMFY